jgi:transposase
MPPANRHEPRRAKSSQSDCSVTEFLAEFPDDAACLEHLWRTRHAPDGEHAECPKCMEAKAFKRYATKQGRQSWTCTACGHHVHPTAGTIFHKSSTSLRLWFHAMYLMTSTRCGISAKQLERELGVHYKTAWRMFNKIRNELMNDEGERQLEGKVEVDETSWGGKPRRKLTRHEAAQFRESRTTILGMVERQGRVRLRVIPSRRGEPLSSAVRTHVNPAAFLPHRRLDRLPPAAARVRLGDDQPLGRYLRRRRHPHEHDRGLLRQPQNRDARRLQARLGSLAPVLPRRVRLALQRTLPGTALDVPFPS